MEFHLFYSKLYNDPFSNPVKAMLGEITLPLLSKEDRDTLDKPLMQQEIEDAIYSLPNNKSLGPDGLPGECYKIHAALLTPKLTQLFAECLESERLPDSVHQAHIMLLLIL